MRRRSPRGWPLASWVGLIGSLLIAANAVRQGATVDPLPVSPVSVPNDDTVSLTARTMSLSPAQPLTNDPFRPGRLLPAAIAAAAVTPDTVMPVSAVAIRLLGTVVRPTGSFALCQLPSDVPRIVHLGERLGELTLIVLEQGRVVFQSPKGARLELSLSQPRS